MLIHKSAKKVFFLYGKLGDQIYALPLVRYLGGGSIANVITGCVLFKRQPYIWKCAKKWNGNKVESWGTYCKRVMKEFGGGRRINCYGYRVNRHNRGYRMIRINQTLVEYHFTGIHLDPPPLWELRNEMIPWLIAENDGVERDIIVHRSFRYQNPESNWEFLKNFPGRVHCVGTYAESKFFKKLGIPWIRTRTVDDLATIINSAKLFIGNQSTPLAIATGLGKPRIIEEAVSINPHYPGTNPLWWRNCTFGTRSEGVLSSIPTANMRMATSLLDDKEITY